MTYRNRMKKPKRHLNLPYWAKRCKVQEPERFHSWFGKTGHKMGHMNNNCYSDTIDPISGKYNGWYDVHYKDRSLKKRHRQAGKAVIAAELEEMNVDVCPTCGSDFCEDHKSCADEEAQFADFEIKLYEREMMFYYEELPEDDAPYEIYDDPYEYSYVY